MLTRHRHSIRLPRHDYSAPQTYFVTIGAYKHGCLFGEFKNSQFIFNNIGQIIYQHWLTLPKIFNLKLGTFQLMPNHIHFIIQILPSETNCRGVIYHAQNMNIAKSHRYMGLINQTPTLGHIIRYFKAKSTFEIRKQKLAFQIFQRNYYEHIIHDQSDLIKCQNYIKNNPQLWHRDRNNPINLPHFRVK